MAAPTVLVADDDALARRFFVEALASLGARVVEAASGAEALSAIERASPAVVLADLRMPGPSGTELADLLRGRTDAPRLFAMSGDLDPATRERLLRAGYADAFAKPVSRETLAALLGLDAEAPRRPAVAEPGAELPVLDDDAARRALGSEATVAAMRGLLRGDLAKQRPALLEDLREGRHGAAVELLHRLRAACGYCGAAGLAEASTALQRAIEQGDAGIARLASDWERAAAALEAALAQR